MCRSRFSARRQGAWRTPSRGVHSFSRAWQVCREPVVSADVGAADAEMDAPTAWGDRGRARGARARRAQGRHCVFRPLVPDARHVCPIPTSHPLAPARASPRAADSCAARSYARGQPVAPFLLQLMDEVRTHHAPALTVLCKADPYASRLRVAGRLFDAKPAEKVPAFPPSSAHWGRVPRAAVPRLRAETSIPNEQRAGVGRYLLSRSRERRVTGARPACAASARHAYRGEAGVRSKCETRLARPTSSSRM